MNPIFSFCSNHNIIYEYMNDSFDTIFLLKRTWKTVCFACVFVRFAWSCESFATHQPTNQQQQKHVNFKTGLYISLFLSL